MTTVRTEEIARRKLSACTSTMEWTPPPDGIAMCQDGAEAMQSTI